MKRTTRPPFPRKTLLATPLLVLLAACGGGGGGGNDPGNNENGGMDDIDIIDSPATAPKKAPQLALEYTQVKTFRFTWPDVAGETEYRLLENPDGVSGFSEVAVIPADAESHDLTVFLPERLNARYILQACNDAGCADSAELSVGGNLARAIGYFKMEQPAVSDSYGYAVALSADGRVLAVGAYDAGENNVGQVAVYGLEGGVWNRQALLAPPNGDELDWFGNAVVLSGDGRRLAVGAPYEDSGFTTDSADNSATNAGAVFLYAADGQGNWALEAYIKEGSPQAFTGFGYSVTLDEDGNTLAVGTLVDTAHIFTRAGSTWNLQANLSAGEADDGFGSSLALSADGDTLAVGAYWDDGPNNSITNSGAVYLFIRNAIGAWSETTILRRPAPQTNDRLGYPLALSSDGLQLATGSYYSNRVTLFRQTAGQWGLEAELTGPGTFGRALAVSADGERLVVGAWGEGGQSSGLGGDPNALGMDNSGAAYLYHRNGGAWDLAPHYIKAPNPDAGDGFGYVVALSGDGRTLAVGAPSENSGSGSDPNDNSVSGAGAVYLY